MVLASVLLALSDWLRKFGSAMAERMPTITITTNSSTRVKPLAMVDWDFRRLLARSKRNLVWCSVVMVDLALGRAFLQF